MLVTIHFKDGPLEQISYEMHFEEFSRLSADFQNYLKHGNPSDGLYEGFTVKGDPSLKTALKIFILFDKVSVIS